MSLESRIVVGLLGGIAAGLFVGEASRALQVVADIFMRLMGMMVLPYLVTALITAFGQMNPQQARHMLVRAAVLLLMIWAVTICVLAVMSVSFPDILSAAFFSRALITPHEPFSFADLFFTANVFESLSQNMVPAVVLFSALTGLAVMTQPGKTALLAPMQAWNAAILTVTRWLIALTPFGVFAIAAVAAGTISPDALERLEAYLIVFAVAAIVLTFWVLPLLLTAVTPFRYGELVGAARGALLTAFVAGNAFIVLPLLIERSRALLIAHKIDQEHARSAADVLVPVMFNFPTAGKLLSLLFIPFAAWLSAGGLSAADYVHLFLVGIPSYFAKAQVALPLLLDVFELPHDLDQLYIPTTVITAKFDAMVTALNLLMVALLGGAWMGGALVLDKARIIRHALLMMTGVALCWMLTRVLLGALIDTGYAGDKVLRAMHSPIEQSSAVVIEPGDTATGSTRGIDQIRHSGQLRIGFVPDNLPMSFINSEAKLVGMEIDLSRRLADALGLRPVFVPVGWNSLDRQLAEGDIDLMPGIWYRPNWLYRVQLTEPYFEATMGLVSLDSRRREFGSIDELRRRDDLTIGVPLDQTQIQASMEQYFAIGHTRFAQVEFWKPFFEGKLPEIDAFLMPAEHASAWTLLYPQYSVSVPQPDPVRVPTAFAVAPGASELLDLVNQWVRFALSTNQVEQAYSYWVLGAG